MNPEAVVGLIHNTALLLGLAVLYDNLPKRESFTPRLTQLGTGLVLGLIGIAVMFTPWQFAPGIVFDTRSVLLSLTGLFFGTIPTLVAVAMTAVLRLYQGGAGAWTGIAVIVTSGALGIWWRHSRILRQRQLGWIELYLFGIVVHLAMLLWMFLLPGRIEFDVFRIISIPVMGIYPIGTLLLGQLLLRQQKRQAQEAVVLENEERLRQIVQNMPVMLDAFDQENRVIVWNAECERVTGYTAEEMLGNPDALEMLYPDEADRAHMMAELAKGPPNFRNLEWPITCKDGTVKIISWSNISGQFPIPGWYSWAVGIDLTQRKQTEEALRESEERFRTAFEHSASGMCLVGLDGVFLKVNPPLCDMLGYAEEDLEGQHFNSFTYPDDLHIGENIIQKMVGGEVEHVAYEKRYLHKNGRLIWVQIHSALLMDELGHPQYFISQVEDITERIRISNALQESEARFRRIAENAQDIIFRIRLFPERKFEYISPAAAHITGYQPEEFYANPRLSLETIHPDDLAKLEAVNRGDSPAGQLMTLRWFHKNGDLYWTEEQSVAIYDENGRLVAIEGIARDITKRIKSEEEIRLQSAALNSAANAIVITDPNGNIMWANPAFSALSGYTLEEVLGMNTNQLLKSGMHDQRFFKEMWDTIVSGSVWHGEIVNRRKDESLYIEEMTITPLKDNAGNISHFIAIKQDISERKKTEEDRGRLLNQVRDQAHRIQRIMDTVPEGLLLISSEGTVITSNPTGKRDLAVLVGSADPDVLTHLGDKPLASLLEKGPSHQWHNVKAQDRQYTITAQPMEDESEENYWVLVIIDVTEERVRQRYQQAQERLATVGQLAAGIAHDFNNVMGVIILYARMLQNIPDMEEKHQKQLSLISDRAQHATNLIAQILDFSRRSVLDMAPLSLRPLIKEMIVLLEQTFPENIVLSLVYDKNEYVVEADPTRLQQVVMNLALNARDAMPNGGQLKFELSSVAVTNEQKAPLPDLGIGDWVQVSVSDTGTGIEPETLPHLFEPFFSTKPPGKGTGLGLAQVYGIVKQHKGSINVTSDLGLGTTFTLYLPLLHVATPALKPPPEDEVIPSGSENILIVEDDFAMQRSVSETLDSLGYTIFTADNGVDAIRLLREMDGTIDLVISDLIMPEIGGVALYHQLQAQFPAIKMLIMTGYAGDLSTREMLKRENLQFIQKPFKLSDLAQKVRNVLNEPLTHQ